MGGATTHTIDRRSASPSLDRLLAACIALGAPLPAPRLLRPTRLARGRGTLLPVGLVGTSSREHAFELLLGARATLAPGDANARVLERVASALSSGAVVEWVRAVDAVAIARAQGASPVGARLVARLLEETVCLLSRDACSLDVFARRELPLLRRLARAGAISRLCLYEPAAAPGSSCWYEQLLRLRSPFANERASSIAPDVPEVRADGELAQWLVASDGAFVLPQYRAATHVWSRLRNVDAGSRYAVELRAARDGAERTRVELSGSPEAVAAALADLEAFLLDRGRDLSTLPRRMRCGSGAVLDASSEAPELLAMVVAEHRRGAVGAAEPPELAWLDADAVARRLGAAVGDAAAKRMMRGGPYEAPGDLASRMNAIRTALGRRSTAGA